MADKSKSSAFYSNAPLLSYEQALKTSSIDDLRPPSPVNHDGHNRDRKRLQRYIFNGAVIGFLGLATILGVAELPVVSEESRKKLVLLGAPLGMRQAWRLFAPNLRTVNWHTLALIETADGTIKAREFPRMEKLSLFDRFLQEKKRSVLGERLPNNVYKRFRPAVARFYARANADADNPPVRVTFVFASAPDLTFNGKNFYYRDQLPAHIFKQVYFDYQVKADDLR